MSGDHRMTQAPAHPKPAGGERPASGEQPAASIEPSTGWHVSHLFYAFDRARLAAMSPATLAAGCQEFRAALDPAAATAPIRLQSWIVPGHKADFGVVAMDRSPLKVDDVHQRLRAGPLGEALVPTYSFVGLTEVSEYVPTVEQSGQRLVGDTVDEQRQLGGARSGLPLGEPVHRNDQPTLLELRSERRLLGDGLGASVDQLGADLGVLRPRRHEAPVERPHERGGRIRWGHDAVDVVRGGDVVVLAETPDVERSAEELGDSLG
jgi:hypothetical protein